MNWAPVLRSGLRGNAWGSATTAGTTTRVSSAGVGASFSAGTLSLTALADGGYQQYMVAPVQAVLASFPDRRSSEEALAHQRGNTPAGRIRIAFAHEPG